MNPRYRIVVGSCALICPLVLFAGLLVAGFLPPHRPSLSAADIASLYQEHAGRIRLGMILLLIASAMYAAFVAAISAQMRRIEPTAPLLTYLQLITGLAVVLFLVIPALIWSVAAFRPERPVEITQALNDIGWFFFVMPFSLPFAQNLAIGIAVLSDRGIPPMWPRWLGFFNIWVAVLITPAALLTYFKAGPFAWNGLLAFWLPAIVFGLWIVVMAVAIIKSADRAL